MEVLPPSVGLWKIRPGKGIDMMMKHLMSLLTAAALLMLLAACGIPSADMTTEEIYKQLEALAGQLPSTDTERIDLSQTESGYQAAFALTWNEEMARFSTEKALEQYSRELAAGISERAPGIQRASLSWTVPYHSAEEPSMEFSYKRKSGQLEQTEVSDRFTDSTFGADAYIPQVTISLNRPGEPQEPAVSIAPRSIAQYSNLPLHKATLLPQSSTPRHKTPGKLITPSGTQAGQSRSLIGREALVGSTGALEGLDAGQEIAAAEGPGQEAGTGQQTGAKPAGGSEDALIRQIEAALSGKYDGHTVDYDGDTVTINAWRESITQSADRIRSQGGDNSDKNWVWLINNTAATATAICEDIKDADLGSTTLEFNILRSDDQKTKLLTFFDTSLTYDILA